MKMKNNLLGYWVAALALVWAPGALHAQNCWSVADGNWSNAVNWSLGTVPVGETIRIMNNGTNRLTGSYTYGPNGQQFSLGDAVGDTGNRGTLIIRKENDGDPQATLANFRVNSSLTVALYGPGHLIIGGNSFTNSGTYYSGPGQLQSGNNFICVGQGWSPSSVYSGTIDVLDNGSISHNIDPGVSGLEYSAAINVNNGTVNLNGENASIFVRSYVGVGAGIDRSGIIYASVATGTVNVTKGTMTVQNTSDNPADLGIGSANGGHGILNVNGGALVADRVTFWSAATSDAARRGTFNVSAGTAEVGALRFNEWNAGHADAKAEVNLTGGTLTVSSVDVGSVGTRVLAMNGGTLKAGAAFTLASGLSAATLGNAGVTVDTAGFDVTIAQALTNAAGATGVLTKSGAGTLTLGATNFYTGDTVVTQGVLKLTGPLCLSANTAVRLYTGAKLKLDFSGTNTVTSLYVNDVARYSGVYGAAELPDYIEGDGYLRTLTPAPPGTVVVLR